MAHGNLRGGAHVIVVLDAGRDGQHQVGEQRIVLEPLVVGDEHSTSSVRMASW